MALNEMLDPSGDGPWAGEEEWPIEREFDTTAPRMVEPPADPDPDGGFDWKVGPVPDLDPDGGFDWKVGPVPDPDPDGGFDWKVGPVE
jgi:hypothetical protein